MFLICSVRDEGFSWEVNLLVWGVVILVVKGLVVKVFRGEGLGVNGHRLIG